MNDDLRAAAASYILSLADDEMILSHRELGVDGARAHPGGGHRLR